MIMSGYGYFVLQRFSDEALVTAGDQAMLDNDAATAAIKYQQAMQLNPQNAAVYEKLAWAEYQLGRDAEAFGHFEGALEMEPDRVSSLFGAGLSSYQLGNYEVSASRLRRVVELTPHHAAAYQYLGLGEYRRENYEAAYAFFTEAWVYSPQDATVNYYLGRVLARRGELDAAVGHFNAAEESGFDAEYLLPSRASVWMKLGNYEAARKDLQTAVELFSDRKDIALMLVRAQYLLQDYAAARTQLVSVQKDLPTDLQPEFLEASGWLSMRERHFDAALNDFNTWLYFDALDPRALNALGWAVFASGDCSTAKNYFEKSLQSSNEEWISSLDSFEGLGETPQIGVELQCQ
jgi:tetratricopeptide (TPR) repeat protein